MDPSPAATDLSDDGLRCGRATEADLPEIAALAARTFPDACPPELPRAAVEAHIRDHLGVESLRGDLDGLRVLRQASGALVGYALLVAGTAMDESCAADVLARPTVGISKFYLESSTRGTSAARVMLEALVSQARAAGCRSLWLATNAGNARAQRFYTRSGFVARGTRTFTVGGVQNSDVVLELPVEPLERT